MHNNYNLKKRRTAKNRITQIKQQSSAAKLAIYLYLTTLEVHTLEAKAKLMVTAVEKNRQRHQNTPSSQSSFVQ